MICLKAMGCAAMTREAAAGRANFLMVLHAGALGDNVMALEGTACLERRAACCGVSVRLDAGTENLVTTAKRHAGTCPANAKAEAGTEYFVVIRHAGACPPNVKAADRAEYRTLQVPTLAVSVRLAAGTEYFVVLLSAGVCPANIKVAAGTEYFVTTTTRHAGACPVSESAAAGTENCAVPPEAFSKKSASNSSPAPPKPLPSSPAARRSCLLSSVCGQCAIVYP